MVKVKELIAYKTGDQLHTTLSIYVTCWVKFFIVLRTSECLAINSYCRKSEEQPITTYPLYLLHAGRSLLLLGSRHLRDRGLNNAPSV